MLLQKQFSGFSLLPTRRSGVSVGVCALVLAACASGCADTYDEVTTANPLNPELLDDVAPAPSEYDASLDYVGRSGQTQNNSQHRFRFDVRPWADAEEQRRGEALYPSHGEFLAAASANATSTDTVIPSVQTIGTYVKQLDDTIYAGIERTVQDGLAPTLEPKRRVLRGAIDALTAKRSAAGDEAIVRLAAALKLGGDEISVPSELTSRVETEAEDFLSSPAESKPIGFYTWSEELTQIWLQDRLLQRALPSGASTCALAGALASDPARRAQYEGLVALYSKLTNPVKSSLVPLLDAAAAGDCRAADPEAFLSRSRSSEVELLDKLYPDGVPAGADLMADLVAAIRDGSIDLAPKPEDGWYQHQLHALETLLVSDESEERQKVGFTARYKKRMREAFETMLVQHRETHVKQADTTGVESASTTPVTPEFRLEPLATVYVRHARSYVMLEAALDEILGEEILDAAVAVDGEGGTSDTLRERIAKARDLFYGLYILSTQDLGFHPKLDAVGDPETDARAALASAADAWLLDLESDPVAKSDVRVMVPIASLGLTRYKYWAVVGVRGTLAGYAFIEGMEMGPPAPELLSSTWLPTEQFIEVESSSEPLTREEFRALCDEHETAAAIATALEAR